MKGIGGLALSFGVFICLNSVSLLSSACTGSLPSDAVTIMQYRALNALLLEESINPSDIQRVSFEGFSNVGGIEGDCQGYSDSEVKIYLTIYNWEEFDIFNKSYTLSFTYYSKDPDSVPEDKGTSKISIKK